MEKHKYDEGPIPRREKKLQPIIDSYAARVGFLILCIFVIFATMVLMQHYKTIEVKTTNINSVSLLSYETHWNKSHTVLMIRGSTSLKSGRIIMKVYNTQNRTFLGQTEAIIKDHTFTAMIRTRDVAIEYQVERK